jgi:hypothetical protein
MTEMSVEQLDKLAGRSRRERLEDLDAMSLCDELEGLDKERAADDIEQLLDPWRSELTGLPLPGFESPRFRNEYEKAFMDWHENSPNAANVRRLKAERR